MSDISFWIPMFDLFKQDVTELLSNMHNIKLNNY